MSHTNWPAQSQMKASGLKKKWNHTNCEAKTKALISCAVTAQLICVIVYALNINLVFSGCSSIYNDSPKEVPDLPITYFKHVGIKMMC